MRKSRFTEEQIIGVLKEHHAGLTVRKRGGRKRALGTRAPMAIPQGANQRWSLDFVSDALNLILVHECSNPRRDERKIALQVCKSSRRKCVHF